MPRKLSIWTAAGAVSVAFATWLTICWAGENGDSKSLEQESASEPTSRSTLPAAPKSQLSPAVIDDIREIRQRLKIDPLAGTSLERPARREESENDGDQDASFVDALRQIPPSEPQATQLDPLWQQPSILDRCEAEYERSIRAAREVDLPLVTSLRAAGRELDRRAADLEDQRQYDQADRLRRLARQLRSEARQVDDGIPATHLR